MRRLPSLLLVLLIVAILAAVAAFFLTPARFDALWQQAHLPAAPLQRARTLLGQGAGAAPAEIRLYGVLEATETYAMSELPGRTASVLIEEGQKVEAGQPLLKLDPAEIQAQVAAAEQALATAKAARAAVAAPPTETTIALADSAVAAAQTRVDSARRSLAQAQSDLEQPLDLDAQINQTRTLIPAAQAGIDQARAELARASVMLENARKDGSREGQFTQQMLTHQQAAAQSNIEAAQARLGGLQRALGLLQKMRANPLGLQAQANAIEQEVRVAEAALALAQAERAVVAEPPSRQAIAVADAQVQAAEAASKLAQWQADRLIVTAPAAGRVVQRLIEPGETIEPGKPLFTIIDASALDVRVYVALRDLPRLQLGARLPVEVAIPGGHRLDGAITYIAPEAQFRPNNILNPDDRGDMVFLVKLRLPNPEETLKAGMPVDVLLP